jgi:hypothetical protein
MPCFDALGHVIVVHMLHDLAGMLYMTNTPCLHVLNHGLMIHISIYDVIITILIVIYVIIVMVLFFWIKLTWKLLKHLTGLSAALCLRVLRSISWSVVSELDDGRGFTYCRAILF